MCNSFEVDRRVTASSSRQFEYKLRNDFVILAFRSFKSPAGALCSTFLSQAKTTI